MPSGLAMDGWMELLGLWDGHRQDVIDPSTPAEAFVSRLTAHHDALGDLLARWALAEDLLASWGIDPGTVDLVWLRSLVAPDGTSGPPGRDTTEVTPPPPPLPLVHLAPPPPPDGPRGGLPRTGVRRSSAPVFSHRGEPLAPDGTPLRGRSEPRAGVGLRRFSAPDLQPTEPVSLWEAPPQTRRRSRTVLTAPLELTGPDPSLGGPLPLGRTRARALTSTPLDEQGSVPRGSLVAPSREEPAPWRARSGSSRLSFGSLGGEDPAPRRPRIRRPPSSSVSGRPGSPLSSRVKDVGGTVLGHLRAGGIGGLVTGLAGRAFAAATGWVRRPRIRPGPRACASPLGPASPSTCSRADAIDEALRSIVGDPLRTTTLPCSIAWDRRTSWEEILIPVAAGPAIPSAAPAL